MKKCVVFLCLCLLFCFGVTASFAATDVLKVGVKNKVFFRNFEAFFQLQPDGSYMEADYINTPTDQIIPKEGDIFLGIIAIQETTATGTTFWHKDSGVDELTGIFVQEIKGIYNDGVLSTEDPFPNTDPILMPGNTNLVHLVLGAPKAGITLTTLDGDTIIPGNYLTGDEIFALYRDTGAGVTTFTTAGTIAQGVAAATNGTLWATFGFSPGLDGIWDDGPNPNPINDPDGSLPVLSGDEWAVPSSDNDGYHYSHTSVFGLPVVNFKGEAWSGLNIIRDNTGYEDWGAVADGTEMEYTGPLGPLGFLIAFDVILSSEFEMNEEWVGDPFNGGYSKWVFASNDPAIMAPLDIPPPPGTCRMTGGQNRVIPAVGLDGLDTWDYEFENLNEDTFVTTGGQIGAPSGGEPRGHWVHQLHNVFSFYSGTTSAPNPDTLILSIDCADPGWCVQARCAPFKQLFWTGVGYFHWKDYNAALPCVSADKKNPTFHYYEAMIGDFGENKRPTREDALYDANPDTCDWYARLQLAGFSGPPGPFKAEDAVFLDSVLDSQFGYKGGQLCDKCPDYYQIRIYCTENPPVPGEDPIYIFAGFISGGNYQIHPETGQQCPATPELVPELFEKTKKVPPGQNK